MKQTFVRFRNVFFIGYRLFLYFTFYSYCYFFKLYCILYLANVTVVNIDNKFSVSLAESIHTTIAESIILLLLLLSAFLIMGRHSGFSFSSCFYQLYLPLSVQPQPCPLSPHPYTSFLVFPFPLSWQLHPQHPSPN